MRSGVAIAILLATTTTALGDRERPKPCTCKRPSDLVVERIGKHERDEHAGYVESRLRNTHESQFTRCLRDNGADSVLVIARYARGAEMPALRFKGATKVTA
jgi:hypothetical protein